MRCFWCQREVGEYYLAERLFHGSVAICTNCCKANVWSNPNAVYNECNRFIHAINHNERNKKVAEINWIESKLKDPNFNWAYSSEYYDWRHAKDLLLGMEKELNDLPNVYRQRPDKIIILLGAPLLRDGDVVFNKETFSNPDLIRERQRLLQAYERCYEWLKSALEKELDFVRNGYPYASMEETIQEWINWVNSSIDRLSDNEQYIHVGAQSRTNDTTGLIQSLETLLCSYQQRCTQLQKDYDELQRKYDDLKRKSRHNC